MRAGLPAADVVLPTQRRAARGALRLRTVANGPFDATQIDAVGGDTVALREPQVVGGLGRVTVTTSREAHHGLRSRAASSRSTVRHSLSSPIFSAVGGG